MTATVDYGSVYEITASVFAAMIDGDEGLLLPRDGGPVTYADPMVAWVDVHGPFVGRAAVTTETPTAHDLVRALLVMGADEAVDHEDLIDAFGEIANVVGGNVKALLPDQGTLGLPQVAAELPPTEHPLLQELHLEWRGQPIDLTIWLAPADTGGDLP